MILESSTRLSPGSSGLMVALASGGPAGPDGQSVHIWAGSAGAIAATTGSRLIIEDDAVAYLQFLTPNNVVPGIFFGDPEAADIGGILYRHSDNALRVKVGGSIILNYSGGAFAFQEATTISTTTGDITLDPSGNIIVSDGVNLRLGSTGDLGLALRTSSLAADEELANVIEGTSNHQGVAANSLIVGNITDDGDIMFLVSDGGNSVEMIKMTAATAELSMGWGALKIGFGADLAAITRPATVTATAAAIITELINVGIFTA